VRRWARTSGIVLGLAGIAAAGMMAALLISGPAFAHNNPCHLLQACPSDHHDYVWFDPSTGNAWDCAEPGASEYDPSLDTTTIAFDGLTYYCRPATGVTTVTGATTNATTMATRVVQATTVATTLVQTGGTSQTSTTTSASASQVRLGRGVLLARRTKRAGCRLGALPDRRCSPGAYYSGLTKAVLCSRSFRTSAIRNVPTAEKHAVEQEYGLAARSYGRSLEIDHIVSLELGGSNDIANLFPERLNAHPGYKAKDKLENKLHDLVCDGKMTLRAAQGQIAANWIRL
jgi:hypothetical protein